MFKSFQRTYTLASAFFSPLHSIEKETVLKQIQAFQKKLWNSSQVTIILEYLGRSRDMCKFQYPKTLENSKSCRNHKVSQALSNLSRGMIKEKAENHRKNLLVC